MTAIDSCSNGWIALSKDERSGRKEENSAHEHNINSQDPNLSLLQTVSLKFISNIYIIMCN